MPTEKKQIIIDADYSGAVKALLETKQLISDLRAANKQLNEDYKAKTITQQQYSAQIEVNNAKIKNLSREVNNNAKALQEEVLQVKGSDGAYQKLNLQYQISAQKAKDLAAAQGLNSLEAIKAAKEADNLNNKLKAIDKSVGQNQRSVGDYGITLSGLPGIFGEMASKGESVLVALRTKFESVKNATMMYSEATKMAKVAQAEATVAAEAATLAETTLSTAEAEGTVTAEMTAAAELARATATETATVATEASSSAMKLFKVALASTGIGVIVVLLGSLIAYFTQTNEGSKMLSKGLGVLGAVFKELYGFVAKTVQGVINFIKGVKDFPDLMSKIGKSIEENLLNRFKAFSVIFQAIGELLHGDFKKGLLDLANGWIQMGTGVENVIGKVTKAIVTVKDGVEAAADSAAKIADMKRALGKAEREAITTLATLEAKANEYKVIMGKAGQSLSVKEREDAINGLIKNEDEQLKIKMNIASKKASIAKAELDLEQKQTGDAMSETRTAYATAQAELIKIRGEFAVNRTTIDARSSKLYLQMLQENLAAEQAIYDQSKTITLNKLKDETISTEERLSLIQKLKDAEDVNYESQKKSFQDYINETEKGTKKLVNFNELMQISDGETLSKRMQEIGLSVKAQGELIKIINSRKTEMQSVNQEEIKILKEQSTRLIASLQNELKINELHDKEIFAGKVKTHQQELDDLSATYENEKKQLNAKLQTEQEYSDAKKLLDQKYNTDKALLDASYAETLRNNKATQLSNELEIVQGNIDAESEIKKKQYEADKAEELRVKGLTEEQKAIINKKYAILNRRIDEDSFNAKLDMASSVTSGLVTLLGKETEAGKLAAAANVAIEGYKSAFKTGAAAAEYFAKGNIPMGILAGVETGIIVENTIKSVADIYAVNTDVSKDVTSKTTITSAYHTGKESNSDTANSQLKDDEINAKLLKVEEVLSPQNTSVFNSILGNLSSLGGSASITNNIGTQSNSSVAQLEEAFTRVIEKMPNPQISWTEFERQAQRQQQLKNNLVVR